MLKFALNVWARLKASFGSWYTTISDICAYCGLDVQPFTYNEYYSKKVSDLFENTEVVVYIMHSKYPCIWGYPGQKVMANPYILKIKHLPDWILPGIMTIMDKIFDWMGTIEKTLRSISTIKKQNQLIYNPTTDKFSIPVDYHCIYVTDMALDILTEEEIIAKCIYVVGISEFLFYESVLDVLYYTNETTKFALYAWFGFAGYKELFSKENLTLNHVYSTLIILLQVICVMFVCNFVIKSIVQYFDRIVSLMVDEFPIKCGWGDHFLSARKKLQKYQFDCKLESEKAKKKMNFLDKIFNVYRSIHLKIEDFLAKHGFTSHINKDTRNQIIKNKTKLYQSNIDNQLVDRSDVIDITLPQTNNPMFKLIDRMRGYN